MKPLLLIPTLFIMASHTVAAADGEVFDKNSLEKIPGATVRCGDFNTVSDRHGRFTIDCKDTSAPIYISASGYHADTVWLTADKQYLSVRLKPLLHELEEVVISGTMRSVSKSESAIPVELYQAKFFRKNPTPSLFEALSIMNGVQPQLNCNICNTGDIHINGMEGPYTMILIDGMPMMSSLSRIYGISGIPTGIIRRMEVVKGAASTLYGSDAVAGLINIITKDALGTGHLNADVSVTSQQEMNIDLSTGIEAKKASGIIAVNGYNYWNKHDINHDNFTDVTQQRRLSLFTKWDFARANKLPFTISGRALAENRWGGELNWNVSYRGSNKVYGESIITNRAELSGIYGLSGGAHEIKIDYSYSYHRQDSYYGTTKFFARQHLGFIQLTGTAATGNHQVTWGVPIRYASYDDNTFLTDKNNANAAGAQVTAAAFVQDEWQLHPKILLLSGLRYEYQNMHGSVISPRLAIKWQPVSTQVFRLSAGNGYRVVNLYTEDHAALTGAREVEIANDLEPEKSWNVNANYNGQWITEKAFFNVDASVFYTRFSNKIIADYTSDPAKIIYDNLQGFAVSKGITINTEMLIKKGPKLMAGLTLMDVYSNKQTGAGNWQKKQQMFAPRFSATYNASYTITAWKLSIDLTGKTFGPQLLPVVPNDFRPSYSPWFSIVNLQLSKKTKSVFEFYLAVKNLLNFLPKDPILHPDDPFDTPGGKYFNINGDPRPQTNPFGYHFDPSYSYAPMQGIKLMLGTRISL